MPNHKLPAARLLTATAALTSALGAGSLAAQSDQRVFHACYVPGSGTVYIVGEGRTREQCASSQHVAFSWTDGLGALVSGATAGGDLRGTLPSPTVSGIQGTPVSPANPSVNQALVFDGTQWAPQALPAGFEGQSAAGDLGGTFPAPTVRGLQGRGVSTLAPQNGQVLSFNTSINQWLPATLPRQSPSTLLDISTAVPIPAGQTVTHTHGCSTGTPTAGGYRLSGFEGGTNPGDLVVLASKPGSSPRLWEVTVTNSATSGTAQVHLELICLTLQ